MSLQPAEMRRRQRYEEARRAILDAAGSILLEDGYERFTMRKLANRCGYTAPTIYHHFGDKKGLIDALLEEVFRGLLVELERVERETASEADPAARMRAHFYFFIEFSLRNPTHYRLLTTPRGNEEEPVPSGEKARLVLQRPLQALADAGRLRVDDISAVQQSFWALLHGLISLQTNRPDYEWSSSLAETSLEAMIDGLVRRESEPDARPEVKENNA